MPLSFTVLLMGLFAAGASLPWMPSNRLAVIGIGVGFSALDSISLLMLPRMRRSYGPVWAAAVPLTIAKALLVVLLGFMADALWIPLAAHITVSLLAVYSTWLEPFQLGVTHQTLVSPKLTGLERPIRLLHLSDLHFEYWSIREEMLNRRIAEINPDLIIVSGDFVNLSYTDTDRAWYEVREVIQSWQAPYGSYAVSGTPLVEPFERVAAALNGSPVTLLHDETKTISINGVSLDIVGVRCAHHNEDDVSRLSQTLQASDLSHLRVLAFHAPDIAPQASEMGIDLYLCGHTHGGQIRLPFYGAILTSSSLGKRFEMGRYTVDDMTLYVSRGIGMEGAATPRARLLCPPEIILWTIEAPTDIPLTTDR